MNKLIKGLCVTLLSCTCLLAATACGNKSECKNEVPSTRTTELEQKDQPDSPEIPNEPDCPECPDREDCPDLPENPDEGKDKNEENHKRKPPRRHGARVRFLPSEFFFGEWSEDGIFYLYLPIRR